MGKNDPPLRGSYQCFRQFLIAQVSRIAAAFNVTPPKYLIKEFDNSVIFPNEGSGIVHKATYEVQGNAASQRNLELQVTNSSPLTPYGIHQMPRCPPP